MDFDKLSIEEKRELRRIALAERSRTYDYEGYEAFFELVTGKRVPWHHKAALREVLKDSSEWVALVVEMFRGAAKTTVWTVVLAAFLIAHFPDKAGLLVQVGDDIATDNSSQVADIIENNPGFAEAFPYIEPDKEMGWGAGGYEVKRTDMGYKEWRRKNATRKDPTFLGVGYKSRALIGKRPFWLILDDINDENNTSSERELRKVKQIMTGTIFPAANLAKIVIVIGTPWNESDAIHLCLASGEFKHFKIPVYTNGEPTWPEMYPEKEIQKQKKLAGDIEFARMYLLDLERTKGLTLKKEWLLPYFNHEHLKIDYPAIIGIDYTSTADPTKEKSDYFALAVGQLLPDNRTVVLADGIYKRVTRFDAQRLAVNMILRYPNVLVLGVEAIFTGNEYHDQLQQNSHLIDNGVFPEPLRGGPFQKKKSHRYETILADGFQKGKIRLSDAENEFLKAFKTHGLAGKAILLPDFRDIMMMLWMQVLSYFIWQCGIWCMGLNTKGTTIQTTPCFHEKRKRTGLPV